MRRADQVSGAVLLVFGVAFAVGARQYPYWTPTGPGSGFLPIWLGLTMAVLAAALLVGATRRTEPGEAWLPGGRATVRLVVVVVGTALFVALMPIVGMTLGTALFLVGLLRFLEGHRWITALGVAVATSIANWLVFIYWLNVPFPVGVLGF
jgi:putative tricarboxylic transport membrane protein